MSAAATAAGYLYASGRLRGRTGKEQEESQHKHAPEKAPQREKMRVAVLPAKEDKPRRTPKIEYRTRRRWTPE